ncbi:MAG: hypothetical protein KME13_03710 [Myxacorys californica WJT36-NPBG1]|jgi:hypothetical protein|nr:hypothetical protein [Myxacorys californica WJT36-NPBG1]
MTQPVITSYFGSTATVIDSTQSITASPTAPVLIIPFDALASAGLDDAASMSDPDKVFGAILKLARVFTQADTDEESGIEVGTPRKTFVTRGNTQKIGHDYSVTVYTADTTPAEFDPDSVV